jgi:hypothetical protein
MMMVVCVVGWVGIVVWSGQGSGLWWGCQVSSSYHHKDNIFFVQPDVLRLALTAVNGSILGGCNASVSSNRV